MERCDGSEHGNAESYVIQGTGINPVLIATPPLEQFATMDSEGAPNFIYDQGLYYPATANYYGYYCTGFESPGDWNDHHRVFGIDGPDFQYAGVQGENIPYVYYTPTYGYAQSPYNPYNPYIPGAIIGVDGSVVGTQQYYPGSGYQHTASASAYYPLVAQPSLVNVLNSFQEPHSLNAGISDVNGQQGLKDTELSEHHDVVGAELAENGTGQFRSGPSGSIPHSAPSHISQGKSVSGSTQGSDQFSFGSVSSSHANRTNVAPVSNGLPNISLAGREWSVDKHRSRLQYGGVSRNGNGNLDSIGEQNRGPRTNRSKSQWMSSASVEAHSTNVEATTLQGNIIIHTDQFNREDFPINYADAKFFVIKSYSEDDVHKSIKYNVWSSTPNGNKRLDNAYEDAQRIAAGKPRDFPVFLFFSVNASGQFCGVAEMVGPVDFDKDMDFWQQDKWSGSFPVKWHIIKDVPNTNFRHILLENNENKPVTNSRDTQEIKWKPGMEMLKIFKNYTLKTSILDDFKYYEERQRIMQDEKNRHLGKTYDASFFVPAFVPGLVPPLNDMSMPKQIDPNNSGKIATSSSAQFPSKSDEVDSSITQKDNVVKNLGRDANDETSILKIGSLTIQPKPTESNSSVTMSRSKVVDVVTVGSMPIKVNGSTGVSSEVLTIGTIPIVPKVKPDKPV